MIKRRKQNLFLTTILKMEFFSNMDEYDYKIMIEFK